MDFLVPNECKIVNSLGGEGGGEEELDLKLDSHFIYVWN
jgi:hypothetical protein